jgi:soluble lytic murein transglycosylase
MDAKLSSVFAWALQFLVSLLLALLLVAPAAASLPSTDEQRSLYRAALQDLQAGRRASFDTARRDLREYPLYPYLEFEDLRLRLNRLGAEDVVGFRARWQDTPLAERLQVLWLNELVRRNDWSGYRQHYETGNHTERHCHYLRALYRTGAADDALAKVPAVWVAGQSQPKACDPVFDAWIQAGGMTQAMAWQRLLYALDARNVNLARYVRTFLRSDYGSLADRALEVYRRPELIANTAAFSVDDERIRALTSRGVRWLARTDAERAALLWEHYRQSLTFDAVEARSVDFDLWIRLARAGVIPRDVDLRANGDRRHEAVAEALLGTTVRQQRWDAAGQWLRRLDEDDRRQPKWQYWLARAESEESDASEPAYGDAQAMLRELSQVRHYYGFLAAHRLGTAPRLNQRASRAHPSVTARVVERAGMRRIAELHGIGDLVNARREWQFIYPRLTEEEQIAAVHLIAEIGWVDQAILGASASELLDDLDIRFPMPYRNVFERESQRTAIPAGLLFGIARQESAFATHARSPAGAVGLMQLMPATAAEVATRLGTGSPRGAALFDPNLNVRLGSEYMAYLLNRYDGQRIHAAAAYNAGPSRVDRWRRELHGLPADAWIESIPFTETRNYVKNVLSFSYIYSQRLGEGAPFLDHD